MFLISNYQSEWTSIFIGNNFGFLDLLGTVQIASRVTLTLEIEFKLEKKKD